MSYYYELFLTKDKIELDDWDNLFNEISRLNGILRSWKLYLMIEDNMIRPYIKSRVKIPSILSCSSSFVLRNIDSFDTIHKSLGRIHFCMSSDKTFSDIYDKFESKKRKILKQIEIKFRLLVPNLYYTTTHLYFKNNSGKIKKYRSFFFIPADQLQMDFLDYNRFFC